jgi:O-antigen biosynthesis protein WbqP
MKRVFDIIVTLVGLVFLSVLILLIVILVKTTSKGPILYWSDRIGRNNKIFKMPKFRTMQVDTPAMATHLLVNPDGYLTPIANFLRKFSLDELPQLYSVLKGDMSIVGPRPALFNQYDLIDLRTSEGIHELTPGLTGWAQVNGRDELPIPIKAEYDLYYLNHRSFLLDIKIIIKTIMKVATRAGITH